MNVVYPRTFCTHGGCYCYVVVVDYYCPHLPLIPGDDALPTLVCAGDLFAPVTFDLIVTFTPTLILGVDLWLICYVLDVVVRCYCLWIALFALLLPCSVVHSHTWPLLYDWLLRCIVVVICWCQFHFVLIWWFCCYLVDLPRIWFIPTPRFGSSPLRFLHCWFPDRCWFTVPLYCYFVVIPPSLLPPLTLPLPLPYLPPYVDLYRWLLLLLRCALQLFSCLLIADVVGWLPDLRCRCPVCCYVVDSPFPDPTLPVCCTLPVALLLIPIVCCLRYVYWLVVVGWLPLPHPFVVAFDFTVPTPAYIYVVGWLHCIIVVVRLPRILPFCGCYVTPICCWLRLLYTICYVDSGWVVALDFDYLFVGDVIVDWLPVGWRAVVTWLLLFDCWFDLPKTFVTRPCPVLVRYCCCCYEFPGFLRSLPCYLYVDYRFVDCYWFDLIYLFGPHPHARICPFTVIVVTLVDLLEFGYYYRFITLPYVPKRCCYVWFDLIYITLYTHITLPLVDLIWLIDSSSFVDCYVIPVWFVVIY